MAPKDKQTTASSNVIATPTIVGGSPCQEAPISGKQKWLSPLLGIRTALPLNFFLKF